MNNQIIIVGAGAAGIFAAANLASFRQDLKITVLEKSTKLLTKVKVSGGGRCNVTNIVTEPRELIRHYPRSNKKLQQAFMEFGSKETVAWFEKRGVAIKVEADGRMFPVTDSSQTIIDCLLQECRKNKVQILTGTGVHSIQPTGPGFRLTTDRGTEMECEKVLVATGGSNKLEGYRWLQDLGHRIEPPVPSLFTFNLVDKEITRLAGVSVPVVEVKIAGTKLIQQGPLLVTHWGFSGPAVLKLSAWGARILQEKQYRYTVLVNWTGGMKEHEVRENVQGFQQHNPLKKVTVHSLFDLPSRLWEYLTIKAEVDPEIRWNNFSGKPLNRLINILVNDGYEAAGKTTFKEEFVTCGGIDLAEVDLLTMESRKVPGLYFAGEVLDIDGVTGGFNFQAAWTGGYLAAKDMGGKMK